MARKKSADAARFEKLQREFAAAEKTKTKKAKTGNDGGGYKTLLGALAGFFALGSLTGGVFGDNQADPANTVKADAKTKVESNYSPTTSRVKPFEDSLSKTYNSGVIYKYTSPTAKAPVYGPPVPYNLKYDTYGPTYDYYSPYKPYDSYGSWRMNKYDPYGYHYPPM